MNFRTPGLLKQFAADLHSGKLHREFHHGPDPTPAPELPDNSKVLPPPFHFHDINVACI